MLSLSTLRRLTATLALALVALLPVALVSQAPEPSPIPAGVGPTPYGPPVVASPATPAASSAVSAASAPAGSLPSAPADYGPTIATALVNLVALLTQRKELRARLRRLGERVTAVEGRVTKLEDGPPSLLTPVSPLPAQRPA